MEESRLHKRRSLTAMGVPAPKRQFPLRLRLQLAVMRPFQCKRERWRSPMLVSQLREVLELRLLAATKLRR